MVEIYDEELEGLEEDEKPILRNYIKNMNVDENYHPTKRQIVIRDKAESLGIISPREGGNRVAMDGISKERLPCGRWKKGQSGNPNGRPVGSIEVHRKEFQEQVVSLMQFGYPKMLTWMDEVAQESPKDALRIMTDFAEFAFPKLSRQTIDGQQDVNITVNTGIPYEPNQRIKELQAEVLEIEGD